MAGPRISISMVGDGAALFEGRLRALEDNLESIPLAAKYVMGEMEKYIAANWAKGYNEQPATDKRWPDHSPLYNTGTLKGSLTQPGAQYAVRTITPYGFEFGTSVFYARLLQRGTRKMSPKPVIPNPRALRALAGTFMREWMLHNTGIIDSPTSAAAGLLGPGV